MKKYLLSVITIMFFIFSIYHFVYFDGRLFIPKTDGKINVNFQIDGKNIVRIEKNRKEKFIVKGVDVDSFIPGHHQNDFAANKSMYENWFRKISDMGANTIRVVTIMDADFYNALYDFNKNSENPLYLIQGIRVDDYILNSSKDALDKKFLGRLMSDARGAVDCIHGRKNIWNFDYRGQIYRKDVSKWVLGFVVGETWNSGTIAYTNHENKTGKFNGKYIYTLENASVFETMIAKVMNEFLEYETEKYGAQHLVSFINSPITDPFEYTEQFSTQMPKIVELDMNKIKIKKRVRSGTFASYQFFEFKDNFFDYLLKDKINVDLKELEKFRNISYARAYSRLLYLHHNIPVIITGHGYSTSRGIENSIVAGEKMPLTEQKQGKLLVQSYKDFISSGCVDVTINSWQDNWNARSWNTSFASNKHTDFLWGNVQTSNQGFGLMTFENKTKNHIIDGVASEWKVAPIQKKDDLSLFFDYDEKYVYFIVKKDRLLEKEKIVIPIDVTPKTGAFKSEKYNMKFDRGVDFLLTINGRENSELYVQSRYNANRANYLKETSGKDPYIKKPGKNAEEFETMLMVLRNNKIFADLRLAKREEKWLPVHLSGKLKHGNTSREDDNFDSQADICYGKDMVEIRIPWQLLNFSNPAARLIHDDYYENYGVKEMKVDSIYVGVDVVSKYKKVDLAKIELKNWETPDVKPVLKKSYYDLRRVWNRKDGADNGS